MFVLVFSTLSHCKACMMRLMKLHQELGCIWEMFPLMASDGCASYKMLRTHAITNGVCLAYLPVMECTNLSR